MCNMKNVKLEVKNVQLEAPNKCVTLKKMSEMVRIHIPMVLLTCLGTQGLALIPP